VHGDGSVTLALALESMASNIDVIAHKQKQDLHEVKFIKFYYIFNQDHAMLCPNFGNLQFIRTMCQGACREQTAVSHYV
jgi:hypothetical protein